MQKVIQSIAGEVQVTDAFTIKEDSKKKKEKEDSSHLEELRRKKRSKAKITETSYRKLVKIKLDINEIEHKIIF